MSFTNYVSGIYARGSVHLSFGVYFKEQIIFKRLSRQFYINKIKGNLVQNAVQHEFSNYC
jgi:hypothetical protein